MVKLNIDAIMKDRKISRYRLQQLTNWNYKRVNDLYFNRMKYLTINEIDCLCILLKCDISDLLTFKN